MEVYVECVLLENLLIDYMLVSGAGLIARKRNSRLRCAVSATFGGIFSVRFPIFGLDGVIAFLLKIAAGVIMLFIAFDFKNFGEVVYCFLFFLLLTYASGGAIIGGCILFGCPVMRRIEILDGKACCLLSFGHVICPFLV